MFLRSSCSSRQRSPRRRRGAEVGFALGATMLMLSSCSSNDGTNDSAGTATVSPPELPSADELSSTLMGWSNGPIPAVDQEVFGTWMARDSWENLSLGQWLADNPDYTSYVSAHPTGAADIGVPLVPHDSGEDVGDMLRTVVAGQKDDIYVAMGSALASTGPSTVFARVWWEMNLNPGASEIDPALFRAAWNHAVPLIRSGFAAAAHDGQELEIVFSPNADGADYRPYYPGDEYVDMMALDVYGQEWGEQTPGEDELLNLVSQQLTAFTNFAGSRDKPVGIAEWGNVAVKTDERDPQMQGRGDFPEYMALILDWAARNDAVYLIYFNSIEGGVEQTLDNTPQSLSLLQQVWG